MKLIVSKIILFIEQNSDSEQASDMVGLGDISCVEERLSWIAYR